MNFLSWFVLIFFCSVRIGLKSSFFLQACDDYSRERNFDYNYDKGNIYHSVEYAQNDLLQLGRFIEAREQADRMKNVVQLQLNATNGKFDNDGNDYFNV